MLIDINIKKKLHNFDLEIAFSMNNGILAVIGESGSGKSMLLKSIAGIENIDAGYVNIDSKIFFDDKKNINIPVKDRRIGYLFQSYALFPHLTVIENIMLVIKSKNKIDKKNKAESLLKKFKILSLANKFPDKISGGEKQRVALARILATEPDILLLDEPFSALDTNLKWEIEYDLINFLKEYKKPTIFVTHDMNEALRVGEKILVLSKGKRVDFGLKNEILSSPNNLETAKFMGLKNFIKIKNNKNLIKDFNISEKYSYMVLDSKKFSFDKLEENIKLKVKFRNFIEDSQHYIFMFESIEYKNTLLTVEIARDISKDKIKDILSLFKSEKELFIYYPKDKILLF
ncbi:MAG: ATP-binding cassette domain-containing protein [Fusobacterium sp.]|nr:ATP-binding cassette domain-containing protein [Fusobacterium sp.]